MTSAPPIIAITLGDPTGIGPEVVAKALSRDALRRSITPIVIGSVDVMDRAFALVDSALVAHAVEAPGEPVAEGVVGVYEPLSIPELAALPYGAASAVAGRAAVEWAKAAARLAMDGSVGAIATAPLNKEAAHLAGYTDVGHQEIYQSMAAVEQVATMLLTTGLRVVHLTTHRPLRLACDAVTRDNVLAKLRLTHEYFSAHGFAVPRIAAAALNPHAGEAGIIGSEEIDAIAPAVADAVTGYAVYGLHRLAMYHDQGHIAVKVQDWAASATTNLGLPFIRTSVDHGTAFDIAGQGVADASGMEQALYIAAEVAGTGRLPSL